MTIAPEFIEPLSKVLAKLYRNQDLEPLMLSKTGDGLYEAWTGEGLPARQTIFNLLQAVNQAGIAELILAEMLARRPSSAELRVLLEEAAPAALTPPEREALKLSAQRGGRTIPGLPDDAFAPGLQKNVRPHLVKLDLQVWLERLVEVRNRVCRIEIGGRAAGTGFLVGPEAVLTNWHVVYKSMTAGKLDDVHCRFDYLRLSDGTRQAGAPVRLGTDGIAASSPCSQGELTSNPELPEAGSHELDFALLHLSEAAGMQPCDGGTRGWLSLPIGSRAMKADDPILIVQHPDGAPMKLAMDTQSIIGSNGNGTRVRYRTNTDNGSSGSPCLTMDWDPVLLHHFGDPAWGNPTFNQGIPLDLIRAAIVKAGANHLLGI